MHSQFKFSDIFSSHHPFDKDQYTSSGRNQLFVFLQLYFSSRAIRLPSAYSSSLASSIVCHFFFSGCDSSL